MSYDEAFYDQINAGSIRSAEVIVPIVMAMWSPESVIDFGCGEGAWLSVFKKNGCKIQGIDGGYINKSRLLIDKSEFLELDLSHEWIQGLPRYDLAISLEVAEHLPEGAANHFVRNLCVASNIVIFSAAIPGQKGEGHVNEQWPSYWEQKFNDNGFQGEEYLRDIVWDDNRVENWYRQNILVFIKSFEKPSKRIKDVVHPANWHDHLIGGKYD